MPNLQSFAIIITNFCVVTIVCSKCDLCRNCSLHVGILKVLASGEKVILNKVIEFYNQTNLFPVDIQLIYFPLDENATKLSDATGWGLVGEAGEDILKSNISVLIGPDSNLGVINIHPHVLVLNITQVVPVATSMRLNNGFEFPNLIRIVPSASKQMQALAGIMKYYRYSEYSIIYSDHSQYREECNLLWLEAKHQNLYLHDFYEFNHKSAENLNATKTILNEIMLHRPHAVVLLSNKENGERFLSEAHELQMTSSNGWIWLVSDSISSANLILTGKNGRTTFDGLLAIRPSVKSNVLIQNFVEFLGNGSDVNKLDYTMMKYADSLLAVLHGFNKLCAGKNITNFQEVGSGEASNLRENILELDVVGFTTNISFERNGETSSTAFDILQSLDSDWITIGEWNQNKISINDDIKSNLSSSPDVKFYLNVVTIIERPFVYFGENKEKSEDPQNLQGFCIEILSELSKKLGFEYKLHLVKDGQFGAYDSSSKTWNGIVGELKNEDFDLAVGSITATEQRGEVVRFLPTFLNVGLKFILNSTAVEKRSQKYSPFAFMFPFNISLYTAIIVSVAVMAGFLCILSKLSPYGIRGTFFLSRKADLLKKSHQAKLSHRALRQLNEDKKDAERGMGLNNALYFVWAALFWQTPERVPRSISARVVTVTWYLAAVVFLASYTANMVAVISDYNNEKPIDSLSELMLQNNINYGTVMNSAVDTALGKSDILLAKRFYKILWQKPEKNFVSNIEDGLEKVNQGQFSLLWDSISLDYAVLESRCQLRTVDVGFGTVDYAFATKRNSSYFNILLSQLHKLKEHGYLTQLYDKYFSELYVCDTSRKSKRKIPHQLTFHDLAGIFYLVAISMGAGLVVLIGEWFMVALSDVNTSDPKAPQTIMQAFRIRRNRVNEDFWRNWFPIETLNEKWSRLALPMQPLAKKVIELRLSEKTRAKNHLFMDMITNSKSEENITAKQKANYDKQIFRL